MEAADRIPITQFKRAYLDHTLKPFIDIAMCGESGAGFGEVILVCPGSTLVSL
jgi:hypothetical protein